MDDNRSASPGSAGMRRVLLVDGNVHVLHVMKSSLDRHGYEVDTALSADVARALHRESRYDVVVVDADARGAAGAAAEALVAEVLAGGAGEPVPLVIAIGGEAVAATRGDGPGWPGPNPERWTKPVSLRYLVARLAEHFGRYPRVSGAA